MICVSEVISSKGKGILPRQNKA